VCPLTYVIKCLVKTEMEFGFAFNLH